MLRRRPRYKSPSRLSVPTSCLTWWRLGPILIELLDNNMVGYDGRFRVRVYVADTLVSDAAYNREAGARDTFERKVEEHYNGL